MTQCQGLPRGADTRHFYPHKHVHNIHLHSFIISGLSVFHLCVCDLIFLPVQMRACCMFICTFSSYHVVSHSSHAGTFSYFVNILFLFQAPALSDGFICVDLSSLRHRLRVVCLLLSKACVQPDVSVTYFIIGSNQHQSPGRQGRCRWLLCALLPCLSERLCQVHVN